MSCLPVDGEIDITTLTTTDGSLTISDTLNSHTTNHYQVTQNIDDFVVLYAELLQFAKPDFSLKIPKDEGCFLTDPRFVDPHED